MTYYFPHEVAVTPIGLLQGLSWVAATGEHGFTDVNGKYHLTHCDKCHRPTRRTGYLRYDGQNVPGGRIKSVALCKRGCDGPIIDIAHAKKIPDPATSWSSRTKIVGDYHLMDQFTVEVDEYRTSSVVRAK